MKPINLYETYKKVSQRIKRCEGRRLTLAKQATKLAKVILEKQTLKSVAEFRSVETKWLELSHATSRSIAEEFETAIRTKNFVNHKPFLNTHGTGWRPQRGTVYAISCAEIRGAVKIGATQSDSSKLRSRVDNYSSRHKLTNVKILAFAEVSKPSFIEKKLHQQFFACRVSVPESKSNEWFCITQKEAKTAIAMYAK